MEFEEIKAVIESFDTIRPDKSKRYIHYRSFRNFVSHFEEIRDDETKSIVPQLLSGYVAAVRNKEGRDFSKRPDWLKLAKAYLNPLSDIYRRRCSFSLFIPLMWCILFGLVADGILYGVELVFRIEHILFFTIAMVFYYCIIRFIKGPIGRVYGTLY